MNKATEIQAPDNIARTVAIVGRPNVGKSALFNRLAGRRISIVHDQPGVTRDRIVATCTLGQFPFTLIDTGGIGSIADEDFSKQVRREADMAMESAHLIILLVDAFDGLTPVDQDLAQLLRRSKKPVLLVVNKVDDPKHVNFAAEFSRLGLDATLTVSAAHGIGIGGLIEAIEEKLPAPQEVEPVEELAAPLRIALVGRPNVGKSSLINAILSDERTIVSEVSGTTRDAVDIPYVRGRDRYTLIDTAGIRARSRHNTSVEVFSVMRSERSIRRADLCLLVLDGPAGATSQDKKIAGLIQEANKPCIVALNKWDLLKPDGSPTDAIAKATEIVRSELFFLHYAPLILVSAKTHQHLARLFNAIATVRKAGLFHIPTGPLNRLLKELMSVHPAPLRQNKRLKILYATQASDRTTLGAIRLVLFVNDPELMAPEYQRYLETRIRQEWPCEGIPILFHMRGREDRDKE